MKRASGRKTRGKALTSLAVSKQRVAQMKEAAAAARREAADASAEDPDRVPRRSRGRPTEPGSLRSIELRTGLSPRQQLRFKRHVALATLYSMFEDARWTRAAALRAGGFLEALTDDQRLKVISQLAELDPRSALRLLQGLLNQSDGVVPVPAPTSGAVSPAADTSARARRGAEPMSARTPNASVSLLLVNANALMMYAARRVPYPTLCQDLRRVAGDLQVICRELQNGAPATTAPTVGVISAESAVQLLAKAKALVLQAAQGSVNPTLQERLQRVVAALETVLVQLQPRADKGRTRS